MINAAKFNNAINAADLASGILLINVYIERVNCLLVVAL